MSLFVNEEKCIGCKQCVKDCFLKDIIMKDNKAYIKNETCIKCGHCIAVCPANAITIEEYDMNEVVEYNREAFDISAETLLNFIKFRRSVRHFKDKAIEPEKLKQIIDAGRFTQTARNTQDVEYVVVSEKMAELKELTYEGIKNLADYVLANKDKVEPIFVRYANMWQGMYNAFKQDKKNDNIFFNAPMVILVISSSELNGGLASSNMELMVNALGLGTFFSGFFTKAAEHKPEINELIDLKEGKKILSCMIVGYPNIKYKRTAPRAEATVKYL